VKLDEDCAKKAGFLIEAGKIAGALLFI
jgi:hypothetical protein